MRNRRILPLVPGLVVTALWAVDCRDPVTPHAHLGPPVFATAATGIALDQQNGTLNESGTVLAKGFNPTNPHLGDAIVVTFFWLGSSNIIQSVTDHLTDVAQTPVGNQYNFVDYVTAGGVSIATYVAINVQNFPDASQDPNQILAVQATLSLPVVDGGIQMSAYTGVDAVSAQALGAHASGSGSGSTPTTADPGAIAVGPGSLVYGVTMSDGLAGRTAPAGFTTLSIMSDNVLVTEADFLVQAAAGSVDPQWTWQFGRPSTWLATVLALNPPATHLAFTVQPSNAAAGSTIAPAVQVTAQDAAGSTIPSFRGTVSVALGANPGGGTLSGTKSVTAVNGVATFADLSVDKVGSGYTLQSTAQGLTGATSAPFDITDPPPPPASDGMNGSGKLGDGRDFATLGFEAKPAGRKVTWVQHCLQGADPASATCRDGPFTFSGTITPGSYAGVAGHPTCRSWSGSGTRKSQDNSSATTSSFTVNMACDNGNPGRGVDFIDITIGGYHDSGYLTGGNLELSHK